MTKTTELKALVGDHVSVYNYRIEDWEPGVVAWVTTHWGTDGPINSYDVIIDRLGKSSRKMYIADKNIRALGTSRPQPAAPGRRRLHLPPATGVTGPGERARGRAVRDCIGPVLARLRS